MNKWLKFSLYILIILTTVVLTSTVVLGWSPDDFKPVSTQNGPGKVLEVSGDFLELIKSAGYILAVIIIFVIAIQFMISSPQKKAELKMRSWMYTIGIVLLIAIPTMMDWVADLGKNIPVSNGTAGGGVGGNLDLGLPTEAPAKSLLDLINFGWGDGGNNHNNSSFGGNNNTNLPSDPPGSDLSVDTGRGDGDGATQQNQQNNSTSMDGYIAPASGATTVDELKAPDVIYFSCDRGPDNVYKPSGGWNASVSYTMEYGDQIKQDSSGYYLISLSRKGEFMRLGANPYMISLNNGETTNMDDGAKVNMFIGQGDWITDSDGSHYTL